MVVYLTFREGICLIEWGEFVGLYQRARKSNLEQISNRKTGCNTEKWEPGSEEARVRSDALGEQAQPNNKRPSNDRYARCYQLLS